MIRTDRRHTPAGLLSLLLAGTGIFTQVEGATSSCDVASGLAADEEIAFFPTFASWSQELRAWTVRLHAWVYEPEHDSLVRERAFRILAEAIELEPDSAPYATFRKRAWPFLADNERGVTVVVQMGEDCYTLGSSAPNGHVVAQVQASGDFVQPQGLAPAGDWVEIQARLPKGDARHFTGRVQFIPPEGWSVISDIDDTIKRSDIHDRRLMFRAAMLEDYEAVAGMAAAYRRAAEAGVVFHYVSASPWQLYAPLEEFLSRAGFPPGSLHLQIASIRLTDLAALFDSPAEFKMAEIEAILAAFPQRKFILIGDATQYDPEVYAAIARKHPEQIQRILIRTPQPSPSVLERLNATFAELPAGLWRVFTDGTSLDLTH